MSSNEPTQQSKLTPHSATDRFLMSLTYPLRIPGEIAQWMAKAKYEYGGMVLSLVTLVYLYQGLRSYVDVSFSWLGQYHYRGLSTGDIELGSSIVLLSWSLKVIWGLIFDNIPIRRQHSKPYLLIASLLGFIGFLACSFDRGVPTWNSFLAFGFLLQLGGASSDVLIDGIVVKAGRTGGDGNSADLQVLCWVALAIGDIVANMVGGVLATPYSNEGKAKLEAFKKGEISENEVYSTPTDSLRWYFRLMLLFPTAVFLLALFYKEPKSKVKIAIRPIGDNLIKVVQTLVFTPAVLKPMVWFYIHNACRLSLRASWNLYNTQVLKLTPNDLAVITTISAFFTIIGTLSYGRFFTNVSYRTIFFWTQLGVACMNFCSYVLVKRWNHAFGVPDYVFLLLTSCADQLISRLNFMPFLVLAAQVCPINMENTFFALLMSLSNFTSGAIQALVSKPLLDYFYIRDGNFTDYSSLVFINFALSIVPLFLVNLLLPTFSSILTHAERLEHGLPVFLKRVGSEDELVDYDDDFGSEFDDDEDVGAGGRQLMGNESTSGFSLDRRDVESRGQGSSRLGRRGSGSAKDGLSNWTHSGGEADRLEHGPQGYIELGNSSGSMPRERLRVLSYESL